MINTKFGEVWRSLAKFGEVWRSLAEFGEVWQRLAKFGVRWSTGEGAREVVNARRQLTGAVVGSAVASTVVLFAASRTWLVEVRERPVPLPPVSVVQSGASLVPALPALALVAMAATGAIVATRGLARRVVAVLLTCVGLAMAAMAATSMIHLKAEPGASAGWALVATVGGLGVATVGMMTLRLGGSWPSLGARYQRGVPPDRADLPELDHGTDPAGTDRTSAEPGAQPARYADVSWWDAIDRGEDPTKS